MSLDNVMQKHLEFCLVKIVDPKRHEEILHLVGIRTTYEVRILPSVSYVVS